MPITPEQFLQWTQDYEEDHNAPVGTTNDETLEQAYASKLAGDQFMAEHGRAMNDEDWKNRYYRQQLPNTRAYQADVRDAANELDWIFEQADKQGSGGSGNGGNAQGNGSDGRGTQPVVPPSPYSAKEIVGAGNAVINNINYALDPITGLFKGDRRQGQGMFVNPSPSETMGWFGRDPNYPSVDGSGGMAALPGQAAMAYQMPFDYEGAEFLQGFGENASANGYGEAGHLGADWRLPANTPVNSVAPGKVVFAGADDTGWGNTVVVQHPDGSTTRYSHLDDVNVGVGDLLSPDDTLGLSGNSGNFWGTNFDGYHLDLSMTDASGNYVDPLDYLNSPYAWTQQDQAPTSSRMPGTASPVAPTGQTASSYGTPYDDIFIEAGQQYGIDPALLVAMARQESGPSFSATAVSPAGAGGVLQLMPGTAADMNVEDVFDPRQNIMGGAQYLNWLSDYGDTDNPQDLLWMYNAGPGNWSRGVRPAETDLYLDRILNTYYPQYRGY